MNVSAEEVRRQTALRQKRHRERVKEALRNARHDTAPTPAAPEPAHAPSKLPALRLIDHDADENYLDNPNHYTDLESEAYDLLDRICPMPSRGYAASTSCSDTLIQLVEADPAGFIDYVRRFVADRVTATQPKPVKRRNRSSRNAAAPVPEGMTWGVRGGRAVLVPLAPNPAD